MKDADRIPEIDAIKAAAVVTVVFIHSLRTSWDPGFTYVEWVCSEMARFAVPAFLSVSGFLHYSVSPIEIGTIAKRLRRILLPYLVVSLAAYAYVEAYPQYASGLSFLQGLLVAGTFGPFYYVFLLTEFVVASWALSRMPSSWVVPVFIATCVGIVVPFLVLEEGVKPTIWNLRVPLYFACWYMMGWAAAANKDCVWRFTSRNRSRIIFGWLVAVGVWLGLDFAEVLEPRLSRVSSLFLIGANIVGLFTLVRGLDGSSGWVTALSDRTYAIYLIHLFFVYTVLDSFGDARSGALVLSTGAAWVAGLLGSLAVIAVLKRLVPRYSRDLIGA